MDADTVREIVRKEVSKTLPFKNFHGITRKNLDSFLVTPSAIMVDPDDLETDPREMWLVAQERSSPEYGYVVVYDPLDGGWGIAEQESDGRYLLVIGAESLAEALDGM